MKRALVGRDAPTPTYGPDLPRRQFAKEGLRTKTMAVNTDHISVKALRPKGHAKANEGSGDRGRSGNGVAGTSLIAAPAIGNATMVLPSPCSVPRTRGSDTPKPPPTRAKLLTIAPPSTIQSKAIAVNRARKDAPVQYHKKRGDKRLCLAVAEDDALMDEAWANYSAYFYSSGETSASNWATWQELHRA